MIRDRLIKNLRSKDGFETIKEIVVFAIYHSNYKYRISIMCDGDVSLKRVPFWLKTNKGSLIEVDVPVLKISTLHDITEAKKKAGSIAQDVIAELIKERYPYFIDE